MLRRFAWAFALAVVLTLAGLYLTPILWQRFGIPEDAPVIGISLDTAWHARVGITTKRYDLAISRAGGRILNLRPESGDSATLLDQIDALLLTGGGDVDPELYGGNPQGAELVDRQRDDFELALIQGAHARDMPILGICRGIHILNVAHGGTLRNLRDDPQSLATHGVGLDSLDAHPVVISSGTRLATILGAGGRRASSFHGQSVDAVGRGLSVAAVSPDGVVEALEMPAHRFVVAIQWHPEIPPGQQEVFESFLDQARRYRASKRSSISSNNNR
jgi:gamma-glutamyl-gamma-aminobutyrate hydrolase PuuD